MSHSGYCSNEKQVVRSSQAIATTCSRKTPTLSDGLLILTDERIKTKKPVSKTGLTYEIRDRA